jgi:hypothetical protein
MAMEPTVNLARRLWHAIEPLHAVVYFDAGPADAATDLGLKGWWMGYFAGRFAPLGPIGPDAATAMAFGFAPSRVARALPDAWRLVSPEAVLVARRAAVARALARALPGAESQVVTLDDWLSEALKGCWFDGRPLAAGWAGLAPDGSEDPYARLWMLTSILREHRGDGHVLAAVALGLRGLDAGVTHVATGVTQREMLQKSRGWTDDEWDASVRRLQDGGYLTIDGRLTGHGEELRRELEETTDRLAAGPVEQVGRRGIEKIIELATPLARRIIDDSIVPVPNPIGVPRP